MEDYPVEKNHNILIMCVIFFIKDVIKREGIYIKYCPIIDLMLADYFTRMQQGKLFRLLRDIIMGISPYPIEECVENNDYSETIE